MCQRLIVSIVFIFLGLFTLAQKKIVNTFDSTLESIKHLTQENTSTGFKKGVLLTEQSFIQDSLKIDFFYNEMDGLLFGINAKANTLNITYNSKDSLQYRLNKALFFGITDTLKIKIGRALLRIFPFSFNHLDPLGKQDLTNTFVTTLLATHKGNCKSLSYLYKILADELGAKCWLSLAPRHIYIKNYSTQTGWYNTELTSGTFPNNGWLMASGYITLDAIKSGLYMDTLSNQQAIANLAIDLALGYQRKTGIQADSFIIKCCDLTLQYHPVNPNALLLKAETMKQMYLALADSTTLAARNLFTDMEKVYFKLYNLGYRQMPEKMYKAWLKELEINKKKYELKVYKTKQIKAQ